MSGFPHVAWLSLGSNSPDSLAMLAKARDGVNALSDIKIVARSPLYETEPQDFLTQPWFLNQTIKLVVGASWTPLSLMRSLSLLETALGRQRSGPRFGPRVIDIDLLLFDNETSDDPECLLPHPRMTVRAFVLAPLRDMAPDLPISGKTAGEWLADLDWRQDGQKIWQTSNF